MAEVKVLIKGFTNADSTANADAEEKSCATITLVRDKDIVMIVDPGVLDDQRILVDKLKGEGLNINDVNYVCLTHSHIDHFANVGMFPKARILEFFGIWKGGICDEWKENFSKDIKIIKTPGHDKTGITLLVKTDDGIVAICGDVFWKEDSPMEDPYADAPKKLIESRKKVLKLADWIIPGHADIYKVEK